MKIYSGVDIIEINRIEKAMQKPNFVDKLFTEKEQRYFQKKVTAIQSVAGMFAAKEAVSKVLGEGIGKAEWKMIEILHNSFGKPFVVLHEEAKRLAEKCGISYIDISISHNQTTAIAFAVGITGGKENVEY